MLVMGVLGGVADPMSLFGESQGVPVLVIGVLGDHVLGVSPSPPIPQCVLPVNESPLPGDTLGAAVGARVLPVTPSGCPCPPLPSSPPPQTLMKVAAQNLVQNSSIDNGQ